MKTEIKNNKLILKVNTTEQDAYNFASHLSVNSSTSWHIQEGEEGFDIWTKDIGVMNEIQKN